jgi:hypothetical protein
MTAVNLRSVIVLLFLPNGTHWYPAVGWKTRSSIFGSHFSLLKKRIAIAERVLDFNAFMKLIEYFC